MSEMEDREKLGQGSPIDSDMELVDASIGNQGSAPPKEDQNPKENGLPPHPGSPLDKSDELANDSQCNNNQILPDAPHDVTITDAKIVDAGPDELPDNKSNGDEMNVEIQLEATTPLPHGDSSIQKAEVQNARKSKNWLNDIEMGEAEEPGTREEQAEFMKEIANFYRERAMEFKSPKFYGEPLNCLKLWRAVIRLGGYDQVTASKLWRQVGESFHPPKTCTTVSWTFRIFYEKALLEYEKHKRENGDLQIADAPLQQPTRVEKEASGYLAPGSGRARRDAAARAMQGWHAQRNYGYGEIGEPIIKDKNINSTPKREKNLRSIGSLKHKTSTNLDLAEKAAINESDKQLVTTVVDVGPSADWVKINVRETKDCFEVYALVPGLLREEVRVQSDPAGRLVITGQPEQLDNPWGIVPFKKVVSLPARIDPLQTSAVVSLHGRLFVRVPFER